MGAVLHIHPNKKTEKLPKNEIQLTKEWVDPDLLLYLFRHKEDVIAVPQGFENIIPVLQDRLYLRQAGITMGKLGREELIPEHALALSTIFNKAITTISLNREQALQYLRKKEVMLETQHKGWALVQYEGHNLGWVKILSNRVNNYYPKEWRILKS